MNIYLRLLLLGIIIALWSCDSGEEGCLDISATNYDVTADVNCASCCTYPSLSMRINYKMDSVDFALNTVYHDASNTPFRISNAQFYISDVKLVQSNSNAIGVTDELTLTFSDNTAMTLEDNFSLYKKSIGAYSSNTIGTINTAESFSKIQFYVGVTSFANHAVPSAMPDGHPLEIQSDTMHWNVNDGYIFNKIQVVKDTSSNLISNIEIGNDGNLILVELDYPITVQSGFDVSLALNLDYAKLLETVQFQLDDDATIISKILNNTTSAFSVAN